MTDRGARLHVAFSYSAGGSLKRALEVHGGRDEFVVLADDFSMGPLDPGDPAGRAAWERDELVTDDPIATSDAVLEASSRVAGWPGTLVAWMSSRLATELCGFRELLWRRPDADIHVVDVAEVDFRPENAPSYDERDAFSIVRDDRIVQHALLDRARPLSEAERAMHRETWSRLRQENAPLRVVTDAGLVSAPISYHDDSLRSRITDHWQTCGRVVADVQCAPRGPRRQHVSDIFLFVRLLVLLDEDDDLESRNDDGPEAPWSMRRCWVRRRPRR